MRSEEEIHDLAKEMARLIGRIDNEALDLDNDLKIAQLKDSERRKRRYNEKREKRH